MPPGATKKGYQKFSHSHLYFLDAKFQVLVISGYPEETSTVFLVEDPIGPIFLFHFILCIFLFIYVFIYLYVFGGGEWGVGAGWSGWIGFGGNKCSKQCQIELKFWLRVVLIVVQILFKGFWKDPIFTENFYSSFWVFGLTLTSIYLLKMVKTNNSHQVIQINQNQGLIFLQFSVKTVITFCSFLFFLGYKWAQCQRWRGHQEDHFFKSSLLSAKCWWMNFGRTPFSTRLFLALVLFFILSDNFFDSEPIFKCHTQKIEIINWISRSRTLCWIFW